MPDQEGVAGTDTASPAAPLVTSLTSDEVWEQALDQLEESDPAGVGGDEQSSSRGGPAADENETADDAGADGDDEDPTDLPDDEKPAQGQSRVERDAQWIMQVAANPAAIQNVPKRLRKDIRAATEATKVGAERIGTMLGEQHLMRTLWLIDEALEIEALADTDAEAFKAAMGQSTPAMQLFQMLQSVRAQKAKTPEERAAEQRQAAPPPQAPASDEYVNRAVAYLADVRDEYGETERDRLAQWAAENKLVNTPEDLRKLKAQGEKWLRKAGDGAPAGVQRRRNLPKPDVSPGTATAPGRYTLDELNKMSPDQLLTAAGDNWSVG